MRLLACLLALLLAMPAAAQEFPKLTGRVVDAANLLSPAAEAEIDAKLANLEATTTRQLVVATIPDLQGYDISDYGYRLGRAWGIGQKQEDNGALLIVAPNERKVRVEVGYGLEGVLTDAWSSILIHRQILPRFREGDMEGGIVAGVDALTAQLALPEEEARAVAAKAREQAGDENGHGFALIPMLFVAFFIFSMLRGLFGGRRYRRRGPWGAPIVIWGPGMGGWGRGRSGWGGGGFGGGGFSGGGGSFGGGGASGGW